MFCATLYLQIPCTYRASQLQITDKMQFHRPYDSFEKRSSTKTSSLLFFGHQTVTYETLREPWKLTFELERVYTRTVSRLYSSFTLPRLVSSFLLSFSKVRPLFSWFSLRLRILPRELKAQGFLRNNDSQLILRKMQKTEKQRMRLLDLIS